MCLFRTSQLGMRTDAPVSLAVLGLSAAASSKAKRKALECSGCLAEQSASLRFPLCLAFMIPAY